MTATRDRTSRRRSWLFVLSAILLVWGSNDPLSGKVASTTIENLAAHADYIVVGTVASVFEVENVPVAQVTVRTAIKGPEVRELFFLARPTWTCDTSTAVPGEELLLFLERHTFSTNPGDDRWPEQSAWFSEPVGFREGVEALSVEVPFLSIAWSGTGRMPLRLIDDRLVVEIDPYTVDLPRDRGDAQRETVSLDWVLELLAAPPVEAADGPEP